MNTPEDFTIRPATNGDLPAIREVLFSVRSEFDVADRARIRDDDLDDLERNYFSRGGAFEVIEDRRVHRIVGCAGLLPHDERRAELCKMYIESSARGLGLGKRLLENLLAAARRGGFDEVWLETNSVLTTATGMYERYGFQPVETDHLLPTCDQAYLLRLV
jgi:putative acetyltransferase